MRLMKRYIHILLIVVITGLFLCSKVVYSNSFNLRPPLASTSWKDTEKQSIQEDVSFLGLIRIFFPSNITKGIPIRLLDIGTGYSAIFTFRVKKVFDDAGINAEIYGIAPNLVSDAIDKGQEVGIMLKQAYDKNLTCDAEEKGKYHIITINAPDFIKDGHAFFETLDYLLAPGGIIIFRADGSSGGGGELFKEQIRISLEHSKFWSVNTPKVDMYDLPIGRWPLTTPLLIRRFSDHKGQALVPLTQGVSFQQTTREVIEKDL